MNACGTWQYSRQVNRVCLLCYTIRMRDANNSDNTSLGRPVILIGMPGSGKTTIGRSAAELCHVDFIDTDDLLRNSLGMSLQDYIDKYGKEAFAREEEQFLAAFDPGPDPVIVATGGSAVLYENAMANLRKRGTVVFLDCDLPSLKKRLWNFESRGIVLDTGDDREKAILDLYMEREPMYYRNCDVRIDQNRKSRRSVVTQLLSEVGKYESETQ